MRKSMFVLCFVFAALASSGLAQDKPKDEPKPQDPANTAEAPAHYYHLEFVVQELGSDSKPTNSRAYTMTMSTDSHEFDSIRTGSRVPVVTSAHSTNNSSDMQYQYVDVGVNIDADHAHEVGRQLSFHIRADISSMAEAHDPNLHQPVIRQNKLQAVVLIPIGKPTVVYTSDALDSKGSMQLIVTAMPMQ